MGYRSFEELEVWKRACRLSINIYKTFEGCRDYGLKDQINRAAVSIASNIAEGCERDSVKDFIRFLNISKGSAAELRTQLYINKEVGLISSERMTDLVSELKEISSMLHGLIKSLKLET